MQLRVININNVHRELVKLIIRTEYDKADKTVFSRCYIAQFQSGRINKSDKPSKAFKAYLSWFDQPTKVESYYIENKHVIEEIYEEAKRVTTY